SRVRMLADETPALLRAFDLLAEASEKLLKQPFAERRQRLESLVAGLGGRKKAAAGSIELTPLERTLAKAAPWLEGGEGVNAKEKRELRSKLKPFETGERGSGDPSRWANERDLEWIALRPELVVEVSFDHVSAGRIRHGAKLLRWREDKKPSECTFDQLA